MKSYVLLFVALLFAGLVSAQNVGIGTNNPTEKLHVNGNIRLADDGNILGVDIIQGFNDIRFFATPASATVDMFLSGDGNLGIGTTTTASKLTVVGPASAGTIPTVRGETNATGGGTETSAPTGVLGIVNGTNGGSWSAGVRGINNSNQFAGVGVLGYTFGTGSGIVGIGARSLEGSGDLINFGGGQFTGMLSKGGGSFKIDHPLDPENKFLYHSFVESPDMMNIYNGNVMTDASGRAQVSLPDWFEPLNRDFRYQLTVIGSFAQATVSQKIENGVFSIMTNEPGVEVSWQVTGIRQDKFAEANRIEVEVEKAEDEKGRYLHPELYGKSRAFQTPTPSGPITESLRVNHQMDKK